MPHSLRKLRRNTRQLRSLAHNQKMTIDDLNRQIGKLRDSYAGVVKVNTDLARSLTEAHEIMRDRDRTLSHPLHRFVSWILARVQAALTLARIKR